MGGKQHGCGTGELYTAPAMAEKVWGPDSDYPIRQCRPGGASRCSDDRAFPATCACTRKKNRGPTVRSKARAGTRCVSGLLDAQEPAVRASSRCSWTRDCAGIMEPAQARARWRGGLSCALPLLVKSWDLLGVRCSIGTGLSRGASPLFCPVGWLGAGLATGVACLAGSRPFAYLGVRCVHAAGVASLIRLRTRAPVLGYESRGSICHGQSHRGETVNDIRDGQKE